MSHLRHVCLVFLAGVVGLTGYITWQYLNSKWKPMNKFHSIHDRPSLLHSTFEGWDIWSRMGGKVDEWGKEAREKKIFKGKSMVITGATKGLGRGIAAQAIAMGVKQLVLPCRKCDVEALKKTLLSDAKMLDPNINNVDIVVPSTFDLQDLVSVDNTVDEMKQLGIWNVDILINNAGVASNSVQTTKQGFEPSFSINFLGPVLFTTRLANEGILAYNARIVTVGSEGHRDSVSIKEHLETTGKPFGSAWGKGLMDVMPRYDGAKLASTTYFLAIARKGLLGSGRTLVDMCPGPVASDVALANTEVWPLNIIADFGLRMLFTPTQRAALPVLRLAYIPDVHGKHFHIYEEKHPRDDAVDEEMQELVMKWTAELLNVKKAPM